MNNANAERLDYDASAAACDECSCLVELDDRANPASMAETLCGSCWPIVQDDDTTTRLPVLESVSVEVMVAMVKGGGR